jgi:hypothetical protein
VEEDEMGRAFSIYEREEEYIKDAGGKLRGKDTTKKI